MVIKMFALSIIIAGIAIDMLNMSGEVFSLSTLYSIQPSTLIFP